MATGSKAGIEFIVWALQQAQPHSHVERRPAVSVQDDFLAQVDMAARSLRRQCAAFLGPAAPALWCRQSCCRPLDPGRKLGGDGGGHTQAQLP